MSPRPPCRRCGYAILKKNGVLGCEMCCAVLDDDGIVSTCGDCDRCERESAPMRCPFCGGTDVFPTAVQWTAVSEDDPDSGVGLDEWQCRSCGNRSF